MRDKPVTHELPLDPSAYLLCAFVRRRSSTGLKNSLCSKPANWDQQALLQLIEEKRLQQSRKNAPATHCFENTRRP